MFGRAHFRPSLIPLAALVAALTLGLPAESAAGPTVKKSRWITWTKSVSGEQGFGILVGMLPSRTLKRPVCLAGEVPLLMRLRAVPTGITAQDARPISPSALGTWRTSVVGYGPDGNREFLAGSARGSDAVDLTTDAGLPWTFGAIYVTAAAAAGLEPGVRSASFQLEFTMTCGRNDVALEPME